MRSRANHRHLSEVLRSSTQAGLHVNSEHCVHAWHGIRIPILTGGCISALLMLPECLLANSCKRSQYSACKCMPASILIVPLPEPATENASSTTTYSTDVLGVKTTVNLMQGADLLCLRLGLFEGRANGKPSQTVSCG
jgi:hypothetical protein